MVLENREMKALWRASAYPLRRLAMIAYDDKDPRHDKAMQGYIALVAVYIFLDLMITWTLFAYVWWPLGIVWLIINMWAAVMWLAVIHKQREREERTE